MPIRKITLSGGQLAGGNSATERAEHDFYATDPVAVNKLIHSLEKDGLIPTDGPLSCLEPCVGNGNIVKAYSALYASTWTCVDIVDRGYPNTIVTDFLTWRSPNTYDLILTNPPYSFAAEFIERCMNMLTESGMCCMFLKLQFLEGINRKALFDKYPPKYIYVFRGRMATWKNGAEVDPNTNKKWATTVASAWFVWIKDSKTEPIIRWLD